MPKSISHRRLGRSGRLSVAEGFPTSGGTRFTVVGPFAQFTATARFKGLTLYIFFPAEIIDLYPAKIRGTVGEWRKTQLKLSLHQKCQRHALDTNFA